MRDTRRHGRLRWFGIALAVFLLEPCGKLVIADGRARPQQPGSLDAGGVVALIAVMDSIASLHPGFATMRLDIMNRAERDSLLEAARARNENSVGLNRCLEALFETPTYVSYFRRFSNVTRELVRDVLLDLPYGVRPSPGGIAETYFTLIRNRDSLRTAVHEFVSTFDYGAMSRQALHWAPDGDYDLPVVHLIYDSNAGSFTADRSPFFNLYSERMSTAQGDATLDRFVDYAEGVTAHEVQHVLVQPLLYPDMDTGAWSWQRQWVEGIVRGLVSEGLATHCNPPSGMRSAVWENREVLAALLESLEGTLRSMRDDAVTPEDVAAWYRDSFQDMPRQLLRNYLEHDASGADLESAMRRYASIRPDLEHALGWWMTSQISARGSRRSAALELLSHPAELFGRYNRALGEEDSALRVHEDVLAYVEQTMP